MIQLVMLPINNYPCPFYKFQKIYKYIHLFEMLGCIFCGATSFCRLSENLSQDLFCGIVWLEDICKALFSQKGHQHVDAFLCSYNKIYTVYKVCKVMNMALNFIIQLYFKFFLLHFIFATTTLQTNPRYICTLFTRINTSVLIN